MNAVEPRYNLKYIRKKAPLCLISDIYPTIFSESMMEMEEKDDNLSSVCVVNNGVIREEEEEIKKMNLSSPLNQLLHSPSWHIFHESALLMANHAFIHNVISVSKFLGAGFAA